MGYSRDTNIRDALRAMGENAKRLLQSVNLVEETYRDLLEARAGDTDVVWARRLHGLPKTGSTVLNVELVEIEEGEPEELVITCLEGSSLLNQVQVGKRVSTTGFADPANNVDTVLVLDVGLDWVKVNAPLVAEQGAGGQELFVEADADQLAPVSAMVAAGVAMHAAHEALDADALRAVCSP